MKTLVRILLIAGLMLVAYGHLAWGTSKLNAASKVPWLQFPLIPGYAVLVMGWSGLLAERVCARIAGR
ncbi:MAG: hypothetical protein AAB341_05070 [Planctomycetota bacterium]